MTNEDKLNEMDKLIGELIGNASLLGKAKGEPHSEEQQNKMKENQKLLIQELKKLQETLDKDANSPFFKEKQSLIDNLLKTFQSLNEQTLKKLPPKE